MKLLRTVHDVNEQEIVEEEIFDEILFVVFLPVGVEKSRKVKRRKLRQRMAFFALAGYCQYEAQLVVVVDFCIISTGYLRLVLNSICKSPRKVCVVRPVSVGSGEDVRLCVKNIQ